jgi:hypothetical protein
MYYIYHIPGIKIGCTDNIKRRMRQQNNPEYFILETHIEKEIASQREKELQKKYGYRIDGAPYTHITSFSKMNGDKNKLNGRIQIISKLGGDATKIKYSKPILCFDKFTNEFLYEFSSQKEASKILNLDESSIRKVLKYKRKSVGNYTFIYK